MCPLLLALLLLWLLRLILLWLCKAATLNALRCLNTLCTERCKQLLDKVTVVAIRSLPATKAAVVSVVSVVESGHF